MSTLAVRIDDAAVLEFLQQRISPAITAVERLGRGEESTAWGFDGDGTACVLRLSRSALGLAKDAFAAALLAPHALPVPAMRAQGSFDAAHYFAITEHVGGVPLDEAPRGTQEQLIPTLLAMLGAIHAVDVGEQEGYGEWDASGCGWAPSWEAFVRGIANEAYWQWDAVCAALHTGRTLVDVALTTIARVAPLCPAQHWLVHGDYGGSNVFTDGRRITGVIDWGEAKYGDWAYDLAWMQYWNAPFAHDWAVEYCAIVNPPNAALAHLAERVQCYQLHIGLSTLAFYHSTGQQRAAADAHDRLQTLLAQRR